MATIGGIDLTGGTVAAFGTLLVFDVFCVTFDQEVKFFWQAPWSVGKILYIINRYLPFVDTFLSLHLLLGKNTDSECLIGFKIVTWLIVVGILTSELILMMRTYALWERNRVVLILLVTLAVTIDIPAIVIAQLEVNSYHYVADDIGCTKSQASNPIIFVAFLLLIISETVIVILTVIRVWRYHRHSKSALLARMYRDGLLYYLYLLSFSVVNVVIAVAAPPSFANWLTTPQRVMHSILGARVLLHIRSHHNDADTQISSVDGSLSFATNHNTAAQQQHEADVSFGSSASSNPHGAESSKQEGGSTSNGNEVDANAGRSSLRSLSSGYRSLSKAAGGAIEEEPPMELEILHHTGRKSYTSSSDADRPINSNQASTSSPISPA